MVNGMAEVFLIYIKKHLHKHKNSKHKYEKSMKISYDPYASAQSWQIPHASPELYYHANPV